MNPIALTAMRISMGLTISRKTAKNLAVRRKEIFLVKTMQRW